MRKLELVDIVGYLPYRLRIQHRDLDFVRCVDSVDFTTGDILMYDDSGANYVCITDCLPILRPMSDLIKPMTHLDINGGEEFIPLVEIAKLLNPYSGKYELGKWNSDSYKGAWQENSVNRYSNGKHYESVKAFDECTYEYYYLTHFDENNYIQRLNREGYCENIMFPNVIKFLNKLHFDYNDLIGKGLAIDINTLK